LGVTVADRDAAVSRATELGGQVLMPPTDNGRVTRALVADPGGNTLSLIQDRPSQGC
jgi:predicted enzyme related to lactoylglutathione lyase